MQGHEADHRGRKALQSILESQTSSSTLAARKEGPSVMSAAFIFPICSILARIDVSGRLGRQHYDSSTINNHGGVAMRSTTCASGNVEVERCHTRMSTSSLPIQNPVPVVFVPCPTLQPQDISLKD